MTVVNEGNGARQDIKMKEEIENKRKEREPKEKERRGMVGTKRPA